MSEESKKVVVTYYASRNFSIRAIKWALNGFSLECGDKLTLVAILPHVRSPSRIPSSTRFGECPKLSFFSFFINSFWCCVLPFCDIRKDLTNI